MCGFLTCDLAKVDNLISLGSLELCQCPAIAQLPSISLSIAQREYDDQIKAKEYYRGESWTTLGPGLSVS